jgi:hypothetical protein
MGHLGNLKKYSKAQQSVDERDMHKPEISKLSTKLAAKKRERVHGKEKASLVEILLHP